MSTPPPPPTVSTTEVTFAATPHEADRQREVSGTYDCPDDAQFALVLGHGAGSHRQSPLMVTLAAALNRLKIATFRYNYPYSEKGRGMDSQSVRLATVRAAVQRARGLVNDLPLFAGGHSMSGRMTSMAQAEQTLPGVCGIVLFAFPLHAGEPDRARAKHLALVKLPLLFLSGERDKMANPDLLRQVTSELSQATLQWVETADHSFKVLKRRQSPQPVISELAERAQHWMTQTLA
jgi:predicted alpha/beta-hydrolase family hydrolase